MRTRHMWLAAATVAALGSGPASAQLKQLSGVIERAGEVYAFEWDGEQVVVRCGDEVVSQRAVERPQVTTATAPGLAFLAARGGAAFYRTTDLLDARGRALGRLHLADGQAWVTAAPARPTRASLDVSVEPPSEAMASQLGIEAGAGLVITAVEGGGAAAKAGVQRFDLLVALDGARGVDQKALREKLAAKRPGDELALTLLRRGNEVELTVALGEAEATGVDGRWRDPALETWRSARAPASWYYPTRGVVRVGGEWLDYALTQQPADAKAESAPSATPSVAPPPDAASLEDVNRRLTEIEAMLRRLEKKAALR
ncbi:MAG: PDZ domain-containing protein [Planctomycetota bacterium]